MSLVSHSNKDDCVRASLDGLTGTSLVAERFLALLGVRDIYREHRGGLMVMGDGRREIMLDETNREYVMSCVDITCASG